MLITRELLLERKDMLKTSYDQIVADMNAYLGALQDVDHWLEVFDEGEFVFSPESPLVEEIE